MSSLSGSGGFGFSAMPISFVVFLPMKDVLFFPSHVSFTRGYDDDDGDDGEFYSFEKLWRLVMLLKYQKNLQ